MADSVTMPIAEGGAPAKSGPPWMLIGLGVGGVVILILLMRQSSGGTSGPTTAAGTSINAALGSIQEENLNLMGQLSGSTQQLSGEIGQVNQGVIANGQSLATIGAGQTAIQNNINSSTQSVLAAQAADTAGIQQNMSTYFTWLSQQTGGIETNMLTYYEWLTGHPDYVSGQIQAPGVF